MAQVKKRRGRPEEIIQGHVTRYLYRIEAYTKNLTFFHPANELCRDPTIKKIYAGLGVRSGVPDLVIMLKGGKTVFIELKAGDNKKASKKQDAFMTGLQALGFPAYLIVAKHGVDAINQIQEILLREGLEGVR